MAYLLDANVFITAKDRHYGLDFCPAFWDWLMKGHDEGQVFSIERVEAELKAIEDELSAWAGSLPRSFFLQPSEPDLASLRLLSEWATSRAYEPTAVSTFLQRADYYLVAQAHAGSHVVVSHEVPGSSPKKIKIPDACIGIGIKCITPFDMLRRERARFVLK